MKGYISLWKSDHMSCERIAEGEQVMRYFTMINIIGLKLSKQNWIAHNIYLLFQVEGDMGNSGQ